MSVLDDKCGPSKIVELIRSHDYRGDFIMSAEQCAELIEIYGKVQRAQGEVASFERRKAEGKL